MKNSIIINNSPKCPYCFEGDYTKLKAVGVDSALVDGEKHFEITMLCNSCSSKSYYFLNLAMDIRRDVNKNSGRYRKVNIDEQA